MTTDDKQKGHALRLLSITMPLQLKVKSSPFGKNEHSQSGEENATIIMIIIAILAAATFS